MNLPTVALRMLRVRALLVALLFALVAMTAVGYEAQDHLLATVLIIAVLGCWYMNGTCLNDLADEAIDKVNLSGAVGRPLANGRTDRRQLQILTIASGGACLLLSATAGRQAILLSAGMLLLNWAYSMRPLRISYRGILAPLMLPLGYVAYPFVLATIIASGDWDTAHIWLLTSLYITFCGRILLKDFRDVIGDRRFGKRTFIVRYGPQATVWASAIICTIGSMSLTVFVISRHQWALAAVICIHTAGLLYALRLLGHTSGVHNQQVIIGSIGRLATATLLCLVIAQSRIHNPGLDNQVLHALLVAVVGLYGLAYSLHTLRHPQAAKVVF